MLVEFIGCSGAGKTEVYQRVLTNLKRAHFIVDSPVSKLLGQRVSSMLPSPSLQNLALEILRLPAVTFSSSFRHNQELRTLVDRIVTSAAVSPWERLRLFRSVRRTLGLHCQLIRNTDQPELVLIDEGTVHLSHVLFGRVGRHFQPELKSFLDLVPTPHILVWVMAPPAIARQRLSRRGSLPMPDRTALERTEFLLRSHEIFETAVSRLRRRVYTVVVTNDSDQLLDTDVVAALASDKIIDQYERIRGNM